MIIGSRKFESDNKYYLMGILNVTPDSFSDGGNYKDMDHMLYRVQEMIDQGADIVDVGGESTRPGHMKISTEEEVERLSLVLEMIHQRFDIPISLDTYKSKVVESVYPYIDMVNDIYGLTYDGTMASVIAQYNLSCCLMANKDHVTNGNITGESYIQNVIKELGKSVELALDAGINKEKIMLDGGVGFGKDYQQNLITINRTNEISKLGYPLLMATSNKGFMGKITGADVKDRRDETVTTTIYGAMHGAKFFRVHNVAANKKALQVLEAIKQERMPV